MIEAISCVVSACCGAAICFLIVRPRLEQLRKLTDRDARGRFVRREP